MRTNPLRVSTYTDNTDFYSNVIVKSDIIIDSLTNISFSKINKIFLQKDAINNNIRFNNFIRGINVKNYVVNCNIPDTETNLSVDKFINSQHIIENYTVIARKTDNYFVNSVSSSYISNLNLDNYIFNKINKLILDSIVNLNIVFNNSFFEIKDLESNGTSAIKIDLNTYYYNNLNQLNIINNTSIIGKTNIIGSSGISAFDITVSANKNISINIYDDNDKIIGSRATGVTNGNKFRLTSTNIPHTIYSDNLIFKNSNILPYYTPEILTYIPFTTVDVGNIANRILHSVVAIGSNIYIFGGTNKTFSEYFNDFYKIDISNNRIIKLWDNNNQYGITKRYAHSMVAINNDIYIFGGNVSGNPRSDFFKINISTEIPTLSTIVLTGTSIPIRYLHTMVAINNDIYIFGGAKGAAINLNDLYKIDTTTNNVTRILDNVDTNIISKRYDHTMVAINNDIYIFGGCFNNDITLYNDLYKINTINNSVTRIIYYNKNIISKRGKHSMVAINNSIYIYGGFDDREYYKLNDFYKIDINNNYISRIYTTGHDSYVANQRYYHKMVAINNDIYIIGGSGTELDIKLSGYLKITNNNTILPYIPNTVSRFILETKIYPRYDHTMVAINNDIYIFGGRYGTDIFNDFYKIDTKTNIVTTIFNIIDIISRRTGNSMVAINQYIYIFGGIIGNLDGTSGGLLNDFYRYDTLNNTNFIKIWDNTNVITKRYKHKMVAINNDIYIFGGSSSTGVLNDFFKIDTITNTVTQIWENGNNNITLRRNFSMVAINNDIYIFGGISSSYNEYFNDLYKFNTLTNNVTQIWANRNENITERYNSLMVAFNNYIYIFGGINLNGVYLNDLQRIDTQTTPNPIITELVNYSVNNSKGILPIAKNDIVAINNDIYIFGGVTNNLHNNILDHFYKITQQYIPITPNNIILTGTKTPPITPRTGQSMVAINNDIYIFGGISSYINAGITTYIYYNDFYKINTLTNNITNNVTQIWADGNNNISKRAFHRMVAIDNNIYIFGGAIYGNNEEFDLYKIETSNSYTVTRVLTTETIPRRRLHSMIAIGNNIFIFGGMTKQFGYDLCLSDFYKIDTGNNNTVSSIVNTKISARNGQSMVTSNGFMYIFGGQNQSYSYLNEMYQLSLAGGNINQITDYNNVSLPVRASQGMVSINNDIYIFGGKGESNKILNDFYRMETANNDFTRLWNNNEISITSRQDFSMVAINNEIYIFGGMGYSFTYLNDFYKITY
jgi:hypothetical protein